MKHTTQCYSYYVLNEKITLYRYTFLYQPFVCLLFKSENFKIFIFKHHMFHETILIGPILMPIQNQY